MKLMDAEYDQEKQEMHLFCHAPHDWWDIRVLLYILGEKEEIKSPEQVLTCIQKYNSYLPQMLETFYKKQDKAFRTKSPRALYEIEYDPLSAFVWARNPERLTEPTLEFKLKIVHGHHRDDEIDDAHKEWRMSLDEELGKSLINTVGLQKIIVKHDATRQISDYSTQTRDSYEAMLREAYLREFHAHAGRGGTLFDTRSTKAENATEHTAPVRKK